MQDVCPCHLYYWHVEVLSWSTRFFFITYVCDRMDNYIASRARSQFMLLKVDRMVGVPEGYVPQDYGQHSRLGSCCYFPTIIPHCTR